MHEFDQRLRALENKVVVDADELERLARELGRARKDRRRRRLMRRDLSTVCRHSKPLGTAAQRLRRNIAHVQWSCAELSSTQRPTKITLV